MWGGGPPLSMNARTPLCGGRVAVRVLWSRGQHHGACVEVGQADLQDGKANRQDGGAARPIHGGKGGGLDLAVYACPVFLRLLRALETELDFV